MKKSGHNTNLGVFARKITELREAKGLHKSKVTGVSASYMQKIERENSIPSGKFIAKLAKALANNSNDATQVSTLTNELKGLAEEQKRQSKRQVEPRQEKLAAASRAIEPATAGGQCSHAEGHEGVVGRTGEVGRGIPPKMAGEIDVLVHDKETGGEVTITEFGLPLHYGAELRVRVQLNHPAFVCVVWITSAGEAKPLFPWKGFDWNSLAAARQTDILMLPPEKNYYYPLDTGPGTETAVLLAREDELTSKLQSTLCKLFTSSLSKLARFPVPNPNKPYRFSSLDPDVPFPSQMRLGEPRLIEDPRQKFKLELCERLWIHFDFVCGVSFSNAGKATKPHERSSTG